ncbi:hypothetical protein V1281_001632 [Nitrobacteraceae bacterium AZCC 2161]
MPTLQITEDIARQIAIDTESKPSRNIVVLDGYGAEVYKQRRLVLFLWNEQRTTKINLRSVKLVITAARTLHISTELHRQQLQTEPYFFRNIVSLLPLLGGQCNSEEN